ncbi:MAG: 2-oxoacid:acceptor oxidoreductase subunit alpha, partial [Chloroflexi bacterium]|nr:2-oxoacid:acceptor oxidoreductase subunit alpha [Chloroflexota bacterium]
MARRQDFVVRFAGEGGQGVVTASEALARIAADVGYHSLTFSTFPSQILGGPTWTQARISTSPVLSPGDVVDVLVALNEEAFNEHKNDLGEEGVVIYDSSFTPSGSGRMFGMPFDDLAKEAGDIRTANMVMMGALANLVGMPIKYLQDFITNRYQARGQAIVDANMKAIGFGSDRASKTSFQIGELEPPQKPAYKQVMIKGNDAVALGALAAGLDAYIGYPISPATPILLYMERNLIGPGKIAYQSSSEIESICAIVGAGYAGKRAMTATAGPGLSLMSEGIGLAWMAEIPCVIVNVQRGGPATGLPTKSEQSDLFISLTPAHGDQLIPVIAPGSVEECFYAAALAVNWAERYQGPVIVLSEQSLSERAQNIPKPDLSKIVPEQRKVYQGDNGYQRYDGFELSPMPIPGKPGAYVANGSEHDAIGDTTHLASRHVQMTQRRFSKLHLLEENVYERDNADAPVAVMPWGGSKGSGREAYDRLRSEGANLAWYYTMRINPLPPKLLEELKKKELVLVPELNYLGQFSSYLRSQGVKAQSITQYTGLPFRP